MSLVRGISLLPFPPDKITTGLALWVGLRLRWRSLKDKINKLVLHVHNRNMINPVFLHQSLYLNKAEGFIKHKKVSVHHPLCAGLCRVTPQKSPPTITIGKSNNSSATDVLQGKICRLFRCTQVACHLGRILEANSLSPHRDTTTRVRSN